MRKLTRNYTNIHGGFRGQYLRRKIKWVFEQQREKLKGNITKISWKNKNYWKNTKTQLEQEAFGKCAYCEAHTKIVAHGDVEHYRPKSIYWWLTYTYYNYLFSCQICNQMYKIDHFPTLKNRIDSPAISLHTTDNELANLVEKYVLNPLDISTEASILGLKTLKENESPTLLNPYEDNPIDWFEWEFEDTERIVRLIPKKNNQEAIQFVKHAEEYLGLNREELMNLRYETFNTFRIFRKALNEIINNPTLHTEIQDQIEKMQQPKAVFSGMCLYFSGLSLEELTN